MPSRSSEATQSDRNVQIKKYTMVGTMSEYIPRGNNWFFLGWMDKSMS